MITVTLVRHGSTIAVVDMHVLPYRSNRIIHDGSEYEVVAVRHKLYTHKREPLPRTSNEEHADAPDHDFRPPDGYVSEMDPPEVHVNHVRNL